MEAYFQAVGLVLIAVVFVLILKNSAQAIAGLLSILVCVTVITLAVRYVQPLIDFIRSVQALSALDGQMLEILLKVVGISATAEIAVLLCRDSGNGAMGQSLQILATVLILCLSLPLLRAVLDMMEELLERL